MKCHPCPSTVLLTSLTAPIMCSCISEPFPFSLSHCSLLLQSPVVSLNSITTLGAWEVEKSLLVRTHQVISARTVRDATLTIPLPLPLTLCARVCPFSNRFQRNRPLSHNIVTISLLFPLSNSHRESCESPYPFSWSLETVVLRSALNRYEPKRQWREKGNLIRAYRTVQNGDMIVRRGYQNHCQFLLPSLASAYLVTGKSLPRIMRRCRHSSSHSRLPN